MEINFYEKKRENNHINIIQSNKVESWELPLIHRENSLKKVWSYNEEKKTDHN